MKMILHPVTDDGDDLMATHCVRVRTTKLSSWRTSPPLLRPMSPEPPGSMTITAFGFDGATNSTR
jgi:hypothetical protein